MTCSMHEVMEGKDMVVLHKMRRGKSRGMLMERAHGARVGDRVDARAEQVRRGRARERLVDLYRARGKRIPPLFAEALELRRQDLIQDTEREMMAPFQGLSRPRWGSASVLLPYNRGEDVFRCEAPDPVVRPSTPTPGAGASLADAGTVCVAPVPRRPGVSPIALVDKVPPPSSDELVRADTPDAADHEDEDLFDEMLDVIILDDSDEELLDEELDSSGSSAESV